MRPCPYGGVRHITTDCPSGDGAISPSHQQHAGPDALNRCWPDPSAFMTHAWMVSASGV